MPERSLENRVTFHLTPANVWQRHRRSPTYLPEAFSRDGFIHCTDGEGEVIGAGNRFYQGDAREYVALVIDPARVTAPIRYEDPAAIFPHIYGLLNVDAVVEVRAVERASDGRFLRLGESIVTSD